MSLGRSVLVKKKKKKKDGFHVWWCVHSDWRKQGKYALDTPEMTLGEVV